MTKASRFCSVAAPFLLLNIIPAAVWADEVVVSDPFSGSSGDLLSRGFYVTSFAGTTLGTVTLAYDAFGSGTYETSLTAHLGAYNGPIIGSTQTITGVYGSTETDVTYNFGDAPVAMGSTITFTQQVISEPNAGSLFYDAGPCSGFLGVSCSLGAPGVIETDGTTSPLDSFRRDSVGVTITSAVPEPSSILLVGIGLVGFAVLKRVPRSISLRR